MSYALIRGNRPLGATKRGAQCRPQPPPKGHEVEPDAAAPKRPREGAKTKTQDHPDPREPRPSPPPDSSAPQATGSRLIPPPWPIVASPSL
eukprot:scaffold237477_cov31-Tisochrysis_lutea.AAC.4